MKIQKLGIHNYRSIADLTVQFTSFYTAISGRNNSGKTNVIRVIRELFKDEDYPFFSQEERGLSIKDDLPKWTSKDAANKEIRFHLELTVFKDSDEGLYQFFTDYLSLETSPNNLTVELRNVFSLEKPQGTVSVKVNGTECDPIKAQEILKKLQSSKAVLFHNSTTPEHPFVFQRRFSESFGALSTGHGERLESAKTKMNAALAGIAREQQKELGELLGRLQERHKVGFSIPKFDPNYFPTIITLGDTSGDFPLAVC